MDRLSRIEETSYLTNKAEYRYIMRVFYNEYEKVHFQLYKEDVMELLRDFYPELFSDYDMEQLKQDLESLVGWKNLTPFQDPKKVYTIEDYKNKQYRYAMTEIAVEIEKMALRIENLSLESSNLSSGYFRRIETAIRRIPDIDPDDKKAVQDWWNELQDDFKRLNRNYKDYLREFYTGRSEKILKSVEFILHKDRFLNYLDEFVVELTRNSENIAAILRRIEEERTERLLNCVVRAELDTPRPASEQTPDLEQNLTGRVHGQWKVLTGWFIAPPGGICESERILRITNEIIQKIIQNAALIVQLENWGISRKTDYQHYMDMFLSCRDLDEAHKLSAHVFGIQNVRHYATEQVRATDSINSSACEEEAFSVTLAPHTRKYTPRVDRTGFVGRRLEKAARKQEVLKHAEENRLMVERYITGNRLSVGDITEQISGSVRITLLSWISLANGSKSRTGLTEFGRRYRLLREEGTCTLHCEDGDIEMPRFVLEFEDEE